MNQTIIIYTVSFLVYKKEIENRPCLRDREHREGDPLEKLEEVVY